jgi:AraC-like DNA-binding protein
MGGVPTEILSDVLRAIRLTGAVFFEVDATSPWAAEAPPASVLGPLVMPGARQVIEYHVVLSGRGWARRLCDNADGEAVELGPGSIVMFPQGDAHVLSSRPGMRADPELSVYRQPRPDERLPFALVQGGGGPERTRIVCGFLGADALPLNPLLQALPPLVHVSGGVSEDGGWLGALIEAALDESRGERLASSGVLARLSELIFIEAIRRYAEGLPDQSSGWLAALADPQIGLAIGKLHARPAEPWTLAALAREVGLSRSVLAERFVAQLGVPPMTYLQNWRMQVAEGLLRDGARSIADVACEVGYASEDAFSRAYKRCTGQSPSARLKRGSEIPSAAA